MPSSRKEGRIQGGQVDEKKNNPREDYEKERVRKASKKHRERKINMRE